MKGTSYFFAIALSIFSIENSWGQTAPGAQPSTIEMFMPFIFIMGIFYFFMIRPQSKRQKEHQKFLTELKRGDEVVTASGILGTIDGLTDAFVTLEVANGVKIKLLKNQIAASQKSMLQSQEGKK